VLPCGLDMVLSGGERLEARMSTTG
jgi:hypothetical protein